MYKFAIVSTALLITSTAHASEVYDPSFGSSHLVVDRRMVVEARGRAAQEAAAQEEKVKKALTREEFSLVNGHLVRLTEEMHDFLKSHFTPKEIAQKVIRGGSSSSSGEEN
jgi:hypothetical protein